MPEFHTSDGVRLHYTDQGTGTPILALAGLTRNGTDFDHVAPQFKGARLIRLDYRGRGQSDWADYKTYTIIQEAADTIALMDHLGLEKAAILGTSRGGLIAMFMAATAKNRLLGVCLNDIGPVIEEAGLSVIKDYIGRNPAQKTYDDAAKARAQLWTSFKDVPLSRWRTEVEQHYRETPQGLEIRYDPKLRYIVLESGAQPAPDLWPLFDALGGLPVALLRGEYSDLLSTETVLEMQNRRPDMIYAQVADRGHVPFLDEPEAVGVIADWLGAVQGAS